MLRSKRLINKIINNNIRLNNKINHFHINNICTFQLNQLQQHKNVILSYPTKFNHVNKSNSMNNQYNKNTLLFNQSLNSYRLFSTSTNNNDTLVDYVKQTIKEEPNSWKNLEIEQDLQAARTLQWLSRLSFAMVLVMFYIYYRIAALIIGSIYNFFVTNVVSPQRRRYIDGHH